MISFDRSKADVFFSMLKNNGFYVDIGVRDGIHDNKTFLLYKMGWRVFQLMHTPIIQNL